VCTSIGAHELYGDIPAEWRAYRNRERRHLAAASGFGNRGIGDRKLGQDGGMGSKQRTKKKAHNLHELGKPKT
jgi:hypothetical protein